MPFAEYKRLLTEAYDLDKPEAPEQELARWLQLARDADGPVLEVMCGSGRFLVPLAARGHRHRRRRRVGRHARGLRTKCRELGVTVALTRQFVQDLDLPRRYALAFIAAGSFGLLIDEDDYRVGLRRVYEHLEPDGELMLEAETPALAPRRSGRWFGRWWDRPDGARIVLRDLGRYDPATRVEEGLGIYELWVDGRLVETEMNNWVRRFWTDTELADELRGAGFVAIDVVADEIGMLLARAVGRSTFVAATFRPVPKRSTRSSVPAVDGPQISAGQHDRSDRLPRSASRRNHRPVAALTVVSKRDRSPTTTPRTQCEGDTVTMRKVGAPPAHADICTRTGRSRSSPGIVDARATDSAAAPCWCDTGSAGSRAIVEAHGLQYVDAPSIIDAARTCGPLTRGSGRATSSRREQQRDVLAEQAGRVFRAHRLRAARRSRRAASAVPSECG